MTARAQVNTYTIQGLKVPDLESRLSDLTAELSGLRTLVKATADAIERVDGDVALILKALGVTHDRSRVQVDEQL